MAIAGCLSVCFGVYVTGLRRTNDLGRGRYMRNTGRLESSNTRLTAELIRKVSVVKESFTAMSTTTIACS